jgi:hypothetical protein
LPQHIRSWTPFGNVKGQAGSSPGWFGNVAACFSAGYLHVIGIADGRAWQTVRSSGGSWTSFVNVNAATGFSGTFWDISVANSSLYFGELHVAGVTSRDGEVWHAIRRFSPYGWTPFTNVKATAGLHPGSFSSISMGGVR